MGQRGCRAEPGDGLAVDQGDLNRRIMKAFRDAEDEVISSGRARELGAMTIEEQRAYLRKVLAP